VENGGLGYAMLKIRSADAMNPWHESQNPSVLPRQNPFLASEGPGHGNMSDPEFRQRGLMSKELGLRLWKDDIAPRDDWTGGVSREPIKTEPKKDPLRTIQILPGYRLDSAWREWIVLKAGGWNRDIVKRQRLFEVERMKPSDCCLVSVSSIECRNGLHRTWSLFSTLRSLNQHGPSIRSETRWSLTLEC
jgi:hypothetical protein